MITQHNGATHYWTLVLEPGGTVQHNRPDGTRGVNQYNDIGDTFV